MNHSSGNLATEETADAVDAADAVEAGPDQIEAERPDATSEAAPESSEVPADTPASTDDPAPGFDAVADRREEMLAQLASAGAVTHAVSLTVEAPTITEENLLNALCTIAEGPVFRLAAWHYACRVAETDPPSREEAIHEQIVTALEDLDVGPDALEVRSVAVDAPAIASGVEGCAIALLSGQGTASDPDPEQRAVIDAGYAIRAAALTAQGISAAIEEAPPWREMPEIAEQLTQFEAHQSGRHADLSTALEKLQELMTRLAARPAPAPQTPPDIAEERAGLLSLSVALQNLLQRLDGQSDALEARIGTIGAQTDTAEALAAQIAAIAEQITAAEAAQTAKQDAMALAVANLSELQQTAAQDTPDVLETHEELQRTSLAMQTLLRRLDSQCSKLEAQAGRLGALEGDAPDLVQAISEALSQKLEEVLLPVSTRLDGIEARQSELARHLDQAPGAPAAGSAEDNPEVERVLGDLLALRKDMRSLLTRYRNQFGRLEGMMQALAPQQGADQQPTQALRGQIDLALAEMLAQMTRQAAENC
ncbi:MAG: hypothetical protein AAFR17_15390 [Pseudomonadota bacterium]